jgi:hypothetical protein
MWKMQVCLNDQPKRDDDELSDWQNVGAATIENRSEERVRQFRNSLLNKNPAELLAMELVLRISAALRPRWADSGWLAEKPPTRDLLPDLNLVGTSGFLEPQVKIYFRCAKMFLSIFFLQLPHQVTPFIQD